MIYVPQNSKYQNIAKLFIHPGMISLLNNILTQIFFYLIHSM